MIVKQSNLVTLRTNECPKVCDRSYDYLIRQNKLQKFDIENGLSPEYKCFLKQDLNILLRQRFNQDCKYFSQNSSPVQQNTTVLDAKLRDKEQKLTDLKEQVKKLTQSNSKLITEIDIKDRELKTYKSRISIMSQMQQSKSDIKSKDDKDIEQKLQQLESENKELKKQIEEMMLEKEELQREYNREISELKSNLRNSIFEEELKVELQCSPRELETDQTKTMTFAPITSNRLFQYQENLLSDSLNQVQFQIQMLKEENNIYRQKLSLIESQHPDQDVVENLRACNNQLANIYESALNKRVLQLEEKLKQLVVKDPFEDSELLNILDNFDDTEEGGESIIQKIKRILTQYQEAEIQLDDWKRNYWILEKKYNNYLDDNQPSQSKGVELDLDFYNNQVASTENIKQELEVERKLSLKLKEEVDMLKSKLQLVQSSNNKFSDHFNTQQKYKRQLSPSPISFSPTIIRNVQNVSQNVIQSGSPHRFYPKYSQIPQIVISKQQRVNPFQYLNTSKLVQP